jgi:hypothetical protein
MFIVNDINHAREFYYRVQLQMFRKRVVDCLGQMPGGATAPCWIRADDGLSYIVKDEAQGVASVRASEYLWLSIARAIALPAPAPEVIDNGQGRLLFGTRREQSSIQSALMVLLAGRVTRGGVHLSRIYAFDLFSANWDRHPGNYLVLEDGGGSLVVFAIDFSHVTSHPGLTVAGRDPLITGCATRAHFPQVVQPYGADIPAAVEIADRLERLPSEIINAILTDIPDEWLSPPDKSAVLSWWGGSSRGVRAAAVKQGLQNGTLI